MIVMQISGGLGNQFFQYALGRSLALKHNVDLKLDITRYEENPIHNGFRLDQFNISAGIASYVEIRRLKGGNEFYSKVARRLGLKPFFGKEKKNNVFQPDILNRSVIYLEGYWQNERYFRAHQKLLTRELTPKEEVNFRDSAYAKKILSCDSVSIHVRRGDYLHHPHIGLLDKTYYVKAIDKLHQARTNPKFFVFSNDIEWCKDNLGELADITFVEDTKSEIADLYLMKLCKHSIVANSSFSWWGAWLGTKCCVVAPRKWLAASNDKRRWAAKGWLEI